MHRLRNGIAGVSLLMVGGIAAGAQPSYSFVELDHENISVDVEEGSLHRLDSIGLMASWQLVNHLALTAEVRRVKEDGSPFSTPYEAFGSYKAGATTFWSMFGVVDFLANANYDFGVRTWGGELGFRARPVKQLELHAGLDLNGYPRQKDRTTASGSLKFGLRVYFIDSLAVGFDHTRTVVGDDLGKIERLSIRYDFSPGE